MNKKNKFFDDFLRTLREGVKPALGCTEPVAVAIAVSIACETFDEKIEAIRVKVSPNIFKNGRGVGIPNTSEVGLVFAAGLAGLAGNGRLGLEVFRDVSPRDVTLAKSLVEKGLVDLSIDPDQGNFFIEAVVETKNHKGLTQISGSHTNITKIIRDGELVYSKPYEDNSSPSKDSYLHKISVEDIRDFVESVDFKDISFLLNGVDLNMAIANYGIENNSGLGLGRFIYDKMEEGLVEKNSINESRMLAAAACDARMAGVNMPVMSSAGSGNQGIAAIIPVYIVSRDEGFSKEKTAQALAFSHLVTSYIKSYTGNLAPICGCAIAAGIGASSSICWALNGSNEEIRGAIRNMIGNLSGMFCDGAKGGCAFKIATATSESIIQAKLSLGGISINSSDGILNESIGQSIRNLARLSNNAMKDVDKEIIDIMLSN